MTSLVFVLFSQNCVLVSKKIKSVTVSSVYPSICQDFTNGNREERYPEGENSKTQKKVQTIHTDKKKSTDHVHRSRRRVQATCTDQDEVSVSGSGDLVTSGSPHRESAKISYLGFTWKVT